MNESLACLSTATDYAVAALEAAGWENVRSLVTENRSGVGFSLEGIRGELIGSSFDFTGNDGSSWMQADEILTPAVAKGWWADSDDEPEDDSQQTHYFTY